MSNLKSLLESLCPADQIKIADRKYKKPTRTEVEKLLRETYFEDYEWTKEVFDCDDFAVILNAFVKQNRYKEGAKLPWAFGEAWVKGGEHAVNIVITSDNKILLIEPQADKIWEASEKDEIVFIKI